MKSIIIGISRPGDPDDVLLSPNVNYVSRCGTRPEKTFVINCKQNDFYNQVNRLRYNSGNPVYAKNAIDYFQKLTGSAFNDLKYLEIDSADTSPFHIRLVTTPMELAQLPFEFVPANWDNAGPANVPLLANPNRVITLTREVLQESEARYVWPKQPRILFAWAQPSEDVPYEEHRKALLESLQPLLVPKKDQADPEPFWDGFLTEISNASLQTIKAAIEKASNEGKPYSHVHLLAHGGYAQGFYGVEFRLLLCASDGGPGDEEKVEGADLKDAVIPANRANGPIVVTLSACDSANIGNVITPTGSLVYQLHLAGIPCVFASQFPLTVEGSNDLVRLLYKNLINAADPRLTLYDARMILLKNGSHDWASLVAYARFPEDIDGQLEAIRLKMLFRSMKTTNEWVDHIIKYRNALSEEKKAIILADINERLDKAIAELSFFLNTGKKSMLETAALRSEHMGLLGSAYKRKAEFHFRQMAFSETNKDASVQSSRENLSLAREFYYGGYDADEANHWTIMQYFSLKIITGEPLSEGDRQLWVYIQFITERKQQKAVAAKEKKEELWACGTLAELYLLKPYTGTKEAFEALAADSLLKCKEYLSLIGASKEDEIMDSTRRQFDRYVSWWPEIYGKNYPQMLKEMATEAVAILNVQVAGT